MCGYSLKNRSKENQCAKRIGITSEAGEQMHGKRRTGVIGCRKRIEQKIQVSS